MNAAPANSLQAPLGQFQFPRLERVIFGPGKVAELAAELQNRKLQRAVVVTGKTLGGSTLLSAVTDALGGQCVAVFKGAKQHVPAGTAAELAELLRATGADCVVSFGGGSPIDTAKVACYELLSAGRELIHIAIPTTLSAGEYTPGAGVTDETSLVKSAVRDWRLQPRTVINDPALTLQTPEWLWAATGMRALDHAVESIYSTRSQPLCDALAAEAIALLLAHLGPSLNTSGDVQLAHRGHCQMAAWFSIFGTGNVRFGISHALGHQIGPRWNVPHGVTSCITLPHVMRFMAQIAPERFGPIAKGLSLPFDAANPRPTAQACADRVQQFIAGFDLPHTLQAAGVPQGEVTEIVSPVAHEVERGEAVGRAVSRAEIIAILEAAYA